MNECEKCTHFGNPCSRTAYSADQCYAAGGFDAIVSRQTRFDRFASSVDEMAAAFLAMQTEVAKADCSINEGRIKK